MYNGGCSVMSGKRLNARTVHILRRVRKRKNTQVGFFHPYCNAGGGGERVLWCAVKALQNKYADIDCVIYTGDCDASPEDILLKARQRFNIIPTRPVKFVFLTCRAYVEASRYPHFTLVGQALGSLVLGLEALAKFVPDIFFDTMGYPFTYGIFRWLAQCKVGCYVHYPVITTDMISHVSSMVEDYNNREGIAQSKSLTTLKLAYYRVFMLLYSIVGLFTHVTMVNSSWTFDHIKKLWFGTPCLVYPPCDTDCWEIQTNEESNSKTKLIISIGQFRPEKNHDLQLKSFAKLLKTITNVRLVLIGSSRNIKDEQRILKLKDTCKSLNIECYVDFCLNISFNELKQYMEEGSVGLHTMRDEHFGIGIVEMMAAGLIMIAHKSGGPMMDIVEKDCGFLAETEEEYVECMKTALTLSHKTRLEMKQKARLSMQRFSMEKFEENFLAASEPLFQ